MKFDKLNKHNPLSRQGPYGEQVAKARSRLSKALCLPSRPRDTGVLGPAPVARTSSEGGAQPTMAPRSPRLSASTPQELREEESRPGTGPTRPGFQDGQTVRLVPAEDTVSIGDEVAEVTAEASVQKPVPEGRPATPRSLPDPKTYRFVPVAANLKLDQLTEAQESPVDEAPVTPTRHPIGGKLPMPSAQDSPSAVTPVPRRPLPSPSTYKYVKYTSASPSLVAEGTVPAPSPQRQHPGGPRLLVPRTPRRERVVSPSFLQTARQVSQRVSPAPEDPPPAPVHRWLPMTAARLKALREVHEKTPAPSTFRRWNVIAPDHDVLMASIADASFRQHAKKNSGSSSATGGRRRTLSSAESLKALADHRYQINEMKTPTHALISGFQFRLYEQELTSWMERGMPDPDPLPQDATPEEKQRHAMQQHMGDVQLLSQLSEHRFIDEPTRLALDKTVNLGLGEALQPSVMRTLRSAEAASGAAVPSKEELATELTRLRDAAAPLARHDNLVKLVRKLAADFPSKFSAADADTILGALDQQMRTADILGGGPPVSEAQGRILAAFEITRDRLESSLEALSTLFPSINPEFDNQMYSIAARRALEVELSQQDECVAQLIGTLARSNQIAKAVLESVPGEDQADIHYHLSHLAGRVKKLIPSGDAFPDADVEDRHLLAQPIVNLCDELDGWLRKSETEGADELAIQVNTLRQFALALVALKMSRDPDIYTDIIGTDEHRLMLQKLDVLLEDVVTGRGLTHEQNELMNECEKFFNSEVGANPVKREEFFNLLGIGEERSMTPGASERGAPVQESTPEAEPAAPAEDVDSAVLDARSAPL